MTGRKQFSHEGLTHFLGSGPPSLYRFHIEEIFVVEPLGQSLAIPIRFLESFEDLHLVLQLGCRGSPGFKFIDDKQYQLDDSATNLSVDPFHFHDYIEDGKSFEVSVLIHNFSQMEGQSSICPRCNYGHKARMVNNGWMNCEGCGMLFAHEVSSLSSNYPSWTHHPSSRGEDPHGPILTDDPASANYARSRLRRIKQIMHMLPPGPSEQDEGIVLEPKRRAATGGHTSDSPDSRGRSERTQRRNAFTSTHTRPKSLRRSSSSPERLYGLHSIRESSSRRNTSAAKGTRPCEPSSSRGRTPEYLRRSRSSLELEGVNRKRYQSFTFGAEVLLSDQQSSAHPPPRPLISRPITSTIGAEPAMSRRRHVMERHPQ